MYTSFIYYKLKKGCGIQNDEGENEAEYVSTNRSNKRHVINLANHSVQFEQCNSLATFIVFRLIKQRFSE